MSIGRRLLNLARGELNALMNRVGERESPGADSSVDPNEDLYRRYALGSSPTRSWKPNWSAVYA